MYGTLHFPCWRLGSVPPAQGFLCRVRRERFGFVHCKVEALEHTQCSVVMRMPGTQMVVERRLDASGRTTRITMDSGDDAVNAVCSGPQLTSLKLSLCSEMTTTSFADAEDDGVRPSVWMTSLAAPNVRVVLRETISAFTIWLVSTADTGSAS